MTELGVERFVEFRGGRAEVRHYDWRSELHGIRRARPTMYVLELNLPRTSAKARSPRGGTPATSTSVAFIRPHEQVVRDIPSGPRRSLFCMLDRDWLAALLPQAFGQEQGNAVEAITSARIEWLLRNIYHELQHEAGLGSAILVESFAAALAVELARRMEAHRDEPRLHKGGLAPWRMRLLDERLHSRLCAPSLTELAELTGLTTRHLCRAFKAETGVTLGDHVERAMIQHARNLLSQTHLSFAEIARQLGFATSTSFSKAFARATGLNARDIERPARSV